MFETSATALCGTTGSKTILCVKNYLSELRIKRFKAAFSLALRNRRYLRGKNKEKKSICWPPTILLYITLQCFRHKLSLTPVPLVAVLVRFGQGPTQDHLQTRTKHPSVVHCQHPDRTSWTCQQALWAEPP